MDQSKKTMRHYYCRDVLWETFEQMAADFDCSIDYLVNEAMRYYARSKNYLNANIPSTTIPPPVGDRAAAAAAYAGMAQPPMAQPPMAQPPMAQPPMAQPPMAQPPMAQPPMAQPPMAQPPMAQPPMAQPPSPYAPYGAPAAGPGVITQPTSQPPAPMPQIAHQMAPPPMAAPLPEQRRESPPLPMGGPGRGQPHASQPPPVSAAPAPAAGVGTLYLLYNNQRYPITKDQFIIGRGSKTSDLPIKDGNISRKHAAVIRRNGTYYIKDLGSTNGIDYKGMRIDNKRIDEGDVFHLCDYELRFTYRTE